MPKVLSVLPSKDSLTISAINAENDTLERLKLEKEIYKFKASDENEMLSQAYEITNNLITAHNIDTVVIPKAGTSPRGNSASPQRIKLEACVQLAARSNKIEADLVTPQKLSNFEKKRITKEEKDFKDAFPSEDKRKTVGAALCVLKK